MYFKVLGKLGKQSEILDRFIAAKVCLSVICNICQVQKNCLDWENMNIFGFIVA